MAFLQVNRAVQKVCCTGYQRHMLPYVQRQVPTFYSTGKARAHTGRHVAIRLARHSDYNAVMRISEGLYNGTDSLPAHFHSFIDDPDVTVFVAEAGDQVVGLTASKFTEGGHVLLGKAARVAPDWRRQGINTKLSLHRDAWIRQNRPTVKYMRKVVLSTGPMAEHLKKTMRPIFSLPFIGYQSGPNLWWRQDPTLLAQLDTAGLPDVVPLQAADNDFCTAVHTWLPAGASGGYDRKPIILVDRDPYTLCPSNLRRFEAHSMLYTLKHEGDSSLSIVTTFKAPCGRMLCINIYAKDFPTLQKHLLKQLYDASLTFASDQICMRVWSGVFEFDSSIHDFCKDVLKMDVLLEPGLHTVFESEFRRESS